MTAGHLLIREPGISVLTDLGRTSGPRFGVPVNGALDHFSARAANILVGNADGAPLIEVTAIAFSFTAGVDVLVSVTGAPVDVEIDGVERPQWQPVSVSAGQTVSLRAMTGGLRSYVAVRGSFETPLLLGSCAPDTVIGFGSPLGAGDTVPVARATAPVSNPFYDAALYNLGLTTPPYLRDVARVDVTDGPDLADFGATAARLWDRPFTVGAKSNHIGLRLSGALPERQTTGELTSRGVPVGAVEVPPGDELLILHRGRGVTAGYPVLAVVTATGLNRLAQVRPGDAVAFRHVSIERGVETARAEHDHLADLRRRITTVFESLGLDTADHHRKGAA
ncbi:biotin-dependent carboxyltransferase family protein [Microbacterium sp. NPDC056044]|uniref:5-oxoprolinase subunit C family protein n=1 Tax=Microbacterium sp. NPDC056044 TaxID=3345690 RepID=UPI0035E3542B